MKQLIQEATKLRDFKAFTEITEVVSEAVDESKIEKFFASKPMTNLLRVEDGPRGSKNAVVESGTMIVNDSDLKTLVKLGLNGFTVAADGRQIRFVFNFK